jgi:hypothetical protein
MIKCLHNSQISSFNLTGVHAAAGSRVSFYQKIGIHFNCGKYKGIDRNTLNLLIGTNIEKAD